ncbi:probable galacturonosyltransferase 7 isoform X1 [Dioscorea cayenensis subsp. rotundata]|uniref:Hexosyltransferase n=1 Tax=Dioscorea cayennensis subsp. rotundata TaxID=55577 RepID=A0AB40BY05_DIOCR|nr:probable galacturonosyltransferase 7 isoform X1 [Dioscorea cayenensis subsp. rotundata]
MKGYVTLTAPPAKRRWKGVAVAVVLALVVFSMLVTLAFLLGLHNRLPYGYGSGDRAPSESGFRSFDHLDVVGGEEQQISEGEEARITNLVERFGHALDVTEDLTTQPEATPKSAAKDTVSYSKDLPPPQVEPKKQPSKKVGNNEVSKKNSAQGSSRDETGKPCQVEFGSYCLWSSEHKEVMKDTTVKRVKDQLFVARAYYPSVAKLKHQEKLSREMKQNIQEHERMLSEAISDADLPPLVEKRIQKMDQTIAKAKASVSDCNNVDKKFRQILDLTEDEAHFHMKQSAFLYHLGIHTMPKSLHCLSMRLTVEYFKSPSLDREQSHGQKFENPNLHHYVIFSKNVLAVSVAINSTVMNSAESSNIVFHIVTDRQNFFALKLWCARNSFKKASVHIINIEDLDLEQPIELDSEEFRVSIHASDQPSSLQMKTEYMSVFSPAHFLLPRIFKNLKRVVVLDDDVVVQRDLSPLWKLDMEGKVNGAVQFCRVRLGHLKSYLTNQNYESSTCAWVSGLNVVNLEKWRELDVTGTYQQLLKKMKSTSSDSGRTAALPASLLAFQGLIYGLDDSWVLSGLGHDYTLTRDSIKHAGVLHYNGNMKPWLELGIPKYKKNWKNFLTKDERFMDQCNVNP